MATSENDWKCYIKVNGKYIEVNEGRVINPETEKEEKVNFFYLSHSNKMVHMDFDDALIEIKESLKHHKCRPKMLDKLRYRDQYKKEYSMLCKKLENLEEAIGNANKRQGCQHPRGQLNESRKLNKNTLSQRDLSSTNSISEQSANRTYLIESEESDDTSKKARKIGDAPNGDTAVARAQRKTSEASFYISADDLRVIGKWASKNRDFIRHKGIDSVPEGTFENDDEYFFHLIFAINPTVVLDKNLPKLLKKMKSRLPKSSLKINWDSENTVNTECVPRSLREMSDEQNEMSQSEFAEQLGLIHSDTLSKQLSRSSRRKSRACSNFPKSSEFHTSALDRIRNKRKLENKLFTDEINKENILKRNNASDQPFSIIDNWKSTCAPKQDTSPKVDATRGKEHRPFKAAVNAFYSMEEDRCIIQWVTQGRNYTKVKGNTIWQDLENLHRMPGGDRTWQSLRTRFLKYILPRLCDYGLKQEEVFKLVKGASEGCMIKRKIRNPIHDANCGLVIRPTRTLRTAADRRNDQLARGRRKISPSRITLKARPKLAEKRKHTPDNHVYSGSDELVDNTLDLSFTKYRNKLRRSNSAKQPTVEPEPRAGNRSTRLGTRKLFTETTFMQSMSEKLSMIVH